MGETEPEGPEVIRFVIISGLPVSMAMLMLETLRYFYPNLSQLRRGRFCSFVFVIITNSLLLLLCRSDLIKDAVKKYDEKTKNPPCFFFEKKSYYILTPHRLKLHIFGVNFLSREFQYFLPLHEKKKSPSFTLAKVYIIYLLFFHSLKSSFFKTTKTTDCEFFTS